MPLRYTKIISRIKDIRRGKLDETQWSVRLTGSGQTAATVRQLFDAVCQKYNLSTDAFEVPSEHPARKLEPQPDLFR